MASRTDHKTGEVPKALLENRLYMKDKCMDLETAKRVLSENGYQVFHNTSTPTYFSRFRFKAKTIFDVGVGTRGTWHLYDTFKDRKLVLIDPLVESFDAITSNQKNEYGMDFHICGLAAEVDELEIYYNSVVINMGSFLERSELTKKNSQSHSRKVPVKRLDDISASYTGPFGIKIDTEGYELEVLKGAGTTLKNTEFLICEVSIKHRFAKSAYKFSELIEFLGKQGFEPLDFIDACGLSPRVIDIVFVKSNDIRLTLDPRDWRRRIG